MHKRPVFVSIRYSPGTYRSPSITFIHQYINVILLLATRGSAKCSLVRPSFTVSLGFHETLSGSHFFDGLKPAGKRNVYVVEKYSTLYGTQNSRREFDSLLSGAIAYFSFATMRTHTPMLMCIAESRVIIAVSIRQVKEFNYERRGYYRSTLEPI